MTWSKIRGSSEFSLSQSHGPTSESHMRAAHCVLRCEYHGQLRRRVQSELSVSNRPMRGFRNYLDVFRFQWECCRGHLTALGHSANRRHLRTGLIESNGKRLCSAPCATFPRNRYDPRRHTSRRVLSEDLAGDHEVIKKQYANTTRPTNRSPLLYLTVESAAGQHDAF